MLDPPINAKFEASFFGGLFHKDYWVLDHADDYSWMIASTASGDYVAALLAGRGCPDARSRPLPPGSPPWDWMRAGWSRSGRRNELLVAATSIVYAG